MRFPLSNFPCSEKTVTGRVPARVSPIHSPQQGRKLARIDFLLSQDRDRQNYRSPPCRRADGLHTRLLAAPCKSLVWIQSCHPYQTLISLHLKSWTKYKSIRNSRTEYFPLSRKLDQVSAKLKFLLKFNLMSRLPNTKHIWISFSFTILSHLIS